MFYPGLHPLTTVTTALWLIQRLQVITHTEDGDLQDGNFLQEQLNLSNAKLKSSEHARHTAESNLTEQANMLEV